MSKEKLPQFALRFLQWFSPDHLFEEIEGDLIQKFNRDVKTLGEKKANRRFGVECGSVLQARDCIKK